MDFSGEALLQMVLAFVKQTEKPIWSRHRSSQRQASTSLEICRNENGRKKHTIWRALDWISKLLTRAAAAWVQG